VEAKKKPFGNRKRPSKLFFCSLLNKKAAKAFFKGKKPSTAIFEAAYLKQTVA